ncbi:hypothetical protein, partial [Blautia sp. AM47-4]|uniref:hypothetical protein n=1 Tax=Blautia sp. AM47-4 TaxID=2292979 RepID=UPI000FF43A70
NTPEIALWLSYFLTPEIALWLSYFLTTTVPLLTPFLPVVLYLTTKNWVKSALVLPNLVKPYQPV